MGLTSILLSVLAVICIVAGVLTSMVPVVGFLFAFCAPMLALVGIVLGGTAMSRARQQGGGGAVGLTGVIFNGIAFAPAMATALTCGMCNACFSAADVTPGQNGPRIVWGPQGWQLSMGDGDAGVGWDLLQGLDPTGQPIEPDEETPAEAPDQDGAHPRGLPPPPLPVAPSGRPPAGAP